MIKKVFLILIGSLTLSSCSVSYQNERRDFLSYRYALRKAGDLHGKPFNEYELLDKNPGFTDYTKLFDTTNSYMNFQCVGDDYDSFHCETTLCLKDKNGRIILGSESETFNTHLEKSFVVCDDEKYNLLYGTMYYTASYWVRLQCEYDVNGDGNKTLLTFEFWKKSFNEAPVWSR